MKIDLKELWEKLQGLNGNDFESAEMQERQLGNKGTDLSMSRSFQARLAAYALKINPHEIKSLPVSEYWQVTTVVGNFLFQGSGEIIRQGLTGEPPSDSATSTKAE